MGKFIIGLIACMVLVVIVAAIWQFLVILLAIGICVVIGVLVWRFIF